MTRFTPKSEQQILGDMARKILARTGLNDLNPGSVLLTLLEAAAQEDSVQYYQMLQIIRNYNLDTTTGSDLDNRAFEFGLSRFEERQATGKITIFREATFQKISTSFYTGFRARLAGDVELPVNDASDFPAAGTVIIGRGTANEEEVAYSALPVDFTNYFLITLDAPLTNDHSLEETIVLKQGLDTTIPAGTVVQVPASGRTEQVLFSTTTDVSILAGEDRVEDVDIQATVAGVSGNINVNAIKEEGAFPTPPFPGARAFNDAAFSNGRDRETDTQLRSRIKSFIQGLSQSTISGIKNAIIGLVDPLTAKRVVSANVISPDNVGLPVKVYIDDGNGFEPSFRDQGQETILESANGGETRLQLDLFPLVKSQIETLNQEPFNFATNGLTLIVSVGSDVETITFFSNQFRIPEAATSEEVVAAINNTSNLLEARTSQIGKRVVITAKRDVNEDIQVLGGTSNTASILNFPVDRRETFYLYKNDLPLSKDGATAVIDSAVGPFDFSGPDQDLDIVVDGKSANTQTITISETDFASPAAAATASASAVAAIINTQLVGAVASNFNGRVRIESNTKTSIDSKLEPLLSDAATTLGFTLAEVSGSNRDYTLNPELGVIELIEPLEPSDKISAGTRNTRAFLTAGSPQDYTFLGGESLLIRVDGEAVAQTITFATQSNSSAQTVADEINSQLIGAKAVTRVKGLLEFLEIRTNTYGPTGSLEIVTGSTANSILNFPLNSEVESIAPHVAFSVSGTSGPYAFVEGDSLVIILDNDPAGKTFVIRMDFAETTTSGASATQFASAGLTDIFETSGELIDFWAVMKSGVNTISGTVEEVQNPTGQTFRYIFDTPPTNFEDFDVGDQASFSDMEESVNNGNFLVTAVSVQGTVYPAVIDNSLSNPGALTPVLGDRYIIASDAQTSLASSVIDNTISNPSLLTPSSGDRYIVDDDANDVFLPPVAAVLLDSASATTTHGFRYLINGVGLNDWVGQNFNIAQYNGIGSPGWLFFTPVDGEVAVDTATSNVYQFDQGLGQWVLNPWGGRAGRIAQWSGTAWTFTNPPDKQVRLVTASSLNFQYDIATNTWTQNDWGGEANKIAEWDGSDWDYTTPSNTDVADVTLLSETYQFNGTNWVPFKFFVEVTNPVGIAEPTSTGTGLVGQRRQITAYNNITGSVTVSSAFRATPGSSDDFVVLPGTRFNVVDFFNNQKITSLSSRADVELVQQASRIQISSKLNGSDGFVQITGGRANLLLQFTTSQIRGLRAYSYFVGLVKLVHQTIYGDETDLVAFPGVGGAGIKFQILPPTVEEVPVSIKVGLPQGVSLSSLENTIKSVIISYVNNLGVGEEVVVARIIDEVMEVEGVLDVEVLSPVQNAPIAQNELARTKASIITVGVL